MPCRISFSASPKLSLNTRDFLVTRLNIDPALIVLPRPEEIAGQITGFASNLLPDRLQHRGHHCRDAGADHAGGLSQRLHHDRRQRNHAVSILRLVPRQYEPTCARFLKTSELAFGGFIRGTALQGLIYGLGVMIFMTIFGIGSPVAVGVITGLS